MKGVKFVAKQFLMIDIHAFTSSTITAIPVKGGHRLLDITKGEDLRVWQGHMNRLIDNAKSVDEIYIMVNKPYILIFLKFSENYISQDDFSQILGDAWTQAENPNFDKNLTKSNLVAMFKKADKFVMMDSEERAKFDSFEDTITIYRGVTSYNAKNIKALSWTTDYQTADWFAHRFNENGTVYKAHIAKKHILAFLMVETSPN